MAFLRSKFIWILVAIVIAGGVWYGLSSAPTSPDLTPTPQTGGSSSVDQGIVSTLLTLRAVKLDGTIFSEAAFLRLKDFSTEIVPEPTGRPNPFAPLSTPSQTGTKSAPIFTAPTH